MYGPPGAATGGSLGSHRIIAMPNGCDRSSPLANVVVVPPDVVFRTDGPLLSGVNALLLWSTATPEGLPRPVPVISVCAPDVAFTRIKLPVPGPNRFGASDTMMSPLPSRAISTGRSKLPPDETTVCASVAVLILTILLVPPKSPAASETTKLPLMSNARPAGAPRL